MSYKKKSNKQIAKDSLLLYIRTFITLVISIYTSRVVLLKLGEDDFGIFTLVGGIAVIFSFLGSSFFGATQRYLTLSLVENNVIEYKKIFTTTIQCYGALSIIVLIIGEPIGIYLVNNTLNIHTDKIFAANVVFQFTLLGLVLGLINAPYKASIIAHEKYAYYAYADVIIKILRLAIVFLLYLSSENKLILYSGLYVAVSIINNVIDRFYCHLNFKGCRVINYWNKDRFVEISKFSSISILRKSSETFANQGYNILLNLFGGVIANASFGISNQVWGTVAGFFLNVQTAYSPQITKSYGAGEANRFNTLVLDSSKYSSFLVILLAIPLIINMPFVMQLWLIDVPQYASMFCAIVILSAFISAMMNPLNTAILATGEIKKYQLYTSVFYFISIPMSWLFLSLGCFLGVVFVVKIIMQIFELIFSAYYLERISTFDRNRFLKDCIISTSLMGMCILAPILILKSLSISNLTYAIISTLIGESLFVCYIWKWNLTVSQKIKLKEFLLSKFSYRK